MIFSQARISSIATFSILVASSTASIFGMEGEKPVHHHRTANQLCFYLNGKREIEQCSNHGTMKFYKDKNEFMKQDITSVLPLSPEKQLYLVRRFERATKKNKVTHASYDLENAKFKATITPLSNESSNGYFVQVRSAK